MRLSRPIAVAAVAVALTTGAASTAAGQPPGAPPATAPAPPAPPMGAAAAPAGEVRLGVPPQVAAFRLRSRENTPNPSEVLLRYAGPDSLRADVFVYPGPDFASRCDSACAAAALDREIADFRTLLPELVRRRYVDSIAIEADEPVPPREAGGWRIARRLTMAARHEGRAERSELHLFYLTGARVKIRLSYVPTAARLGAAAAFADSLVPALTRPIAAAPPPPP